MRLQTQQRENPYKYPQKPYTAWNLESTGYGCLSISVRPIVSEFWRCIGHITAVWRCCLSLTPSRGWSLKNTQTTHILSETRIHGLHLFRSLCQSICNQYLEDAKWRSTPDIRRGSVDHPSEGDLLRISG